MQIIARCLGGSTLYGLNNPASDLDIRGVFVNTSLSETIGMSRFEHQIKQDKQDDKVFRELRHFFNLLQKGNSECYELLWNKQWIERDDNFIYIQSFRSRLTDTKKLFKVLRGYSQGERNIIFSSSSGKLGDKRRIAVEKYGYSYRNLVHFIRLCFCGSHYFDKGEYPVNMRDYSVYDLLYSIKNHPEAFERKNVEELITEWEKKLVDSFEARDRTKDTYFEPELADRLLAHVYFPIIEKAVKEM